MSDYKEKINPILAEMVRGTLVESYSRGSYMVMDHKGNVIDSVGDVDRPVFSRSSLKPLQALALVVSGAAHHYGLSPSHLALCCSSHNGETEHVALVENWLKALNLDETCLECGAAWPAHMETTHFHVRAGTPKSKMFNVCSGKHMGFLSVASYLGHLPQGYTTWEHPVQVYSRDIISELAEHDLHQAPRGIDGCQAPVMAMSLKDFARAIAKMAKPEQLSLSYKNACEQIVSAIAEHPYLVAGRDRFCTDIALHTKGKVLAKMGADGVFSAIIRDMGWGISLKIDDGNLRSAEVALAKILHRHHILEESAPFLRPLVTNSNDMVVGWWQ